MQSDGKTRSRRSDDFSKKPRKPSFATERAKTFGDPYQFPDHYPGWPPGTVPEEHPF